MAGAADDPRKASFLAKIAGMAHLMGVAVVAEGVETEQELRLCFEAGCDYAQGFYVARPSLEIDSLASSYSLALTASRGTRRSAFQGGRVNAEKFSATAPIAIDEELSSVLARFRREPETTLLPVVDAEGEPIGAYRARDFLQYVYSPFGIALLEHMISEAGSASLVARVPTAAVGTDLGRIVELYGANPECGGVLMTEGGKYAGVLPAEALLALVADMELADARDPESAYAVAGKSARIGDLRRAPRRSKGRRRLRVLRLR